MRNALGLMLATVIAAVAIAGIWYWTSAPRADAAPPKTIAARPSDPLPPAAKLAAKDDVNVTAAVNKPAPAAPPPAAVAQTSTCTNPNALGVSRVVEVDTTGGP